MGPLVSVIIPNYNHSHYLDKRIQSVLNQSYENFEVIILDDHSTDNSLEIISKYKLDSHVSKIIVNEENSGSPFKQWHKGISLANGDIVWIAESDDYCESIFLEKLVSAFNSCQNCSVAYCNVHIVQNETVGDILLNESNNVKFFKGEEYIHKYLTLGCSIINASSAIFCRKKALLIPETYMRMHAAGDYMFWTELALQGSVVFVEQELSYFRRHNDVETDKRSADGSNFIFDRKVFDYICEQIDISEEEKNVAYAHHALMASKTKFKENVYPLVSAAWNVDRQIRDFDDSESVENIESKLRLESLVAKHLRTAGIDTNANCGKYLAELAKVSIVRFISVSVYLVSHYGLGQTLRDYKVSIRVLMNELR